MTPFISPNWALIPLDSTVLLILSLHLNSFVNYGIVLLVNLNSKFESNVILSLNTASTPDANLRSLTLNCYQLQLRIDFYLEKESNFQSQLWEF